MLQTAAYKDFRNFIKRRIYSAQYRVGSTYYSANISGIDITDDGTVRVKIPIPHGTAGTINQVRLFNVEGELWVSKDVNIVLETSRTHFMQWFNFAISESEVS